MWKNSLVAGSTGPCPEIWRRVRWAPPGRMSVPRPCFLGEGCSLVGHGSFLNHAVPQSCSVIRSRRLSSSRSGLAASSVLDSAAAAQICPMRSARSVVIPVTMRGYFVPEVGVNDLLGLYELCEAVDGIAPGAPPRHPSTPPSDVLRFHRRIWETLEQLWAAAADRRELYRPGSVGKTDSPRMRPAGCPMRRASTRRS